MNKFRLLVMSAAVAPLAHASVSLGGGTGIFGKITAFFQTIVDFLGGAGTLFVIFIAAVAAICLWVFAPKQASESIAWLFRICIGAIALFSLGTLITWLRSF